MEESRAPIFRISLIFFQFLLYLSFHPTFHGLLFHSTTFLSFLSFPHTYSFLYVCTISMAGRGDRTIRCESHDNQRRYWKSDFPAKLRTESIRSVPMANFIHVGPRDKTCTLFAPAGSIYRLSRPAPYRIL